MTALAELRESRELLVNLTLREVRGKYKRTALGQGWSLVNPLATMLIFTAVFGLLLRVKVPPAQPRGLNVFALWLVCGLLPWSFMSNAVTGGMGSLLDNANLVQKVYFRREVLVGSTVFSWVVTFAIELSVVTVAVLAFGAFPLPYLPLVVVFIGVLTLFSLGIALGLSVANVYFRDTRHFVGIAMQMWFYLTPVVYPVVPYVHNAQIKLDHKGWLGHHFPLEFIYRLNPMERFVTVFRDLLYDNRWPALTDSMFAVGSALVSIVAGYALFRHFQARIAEEL